MYDLKSSLGIFKVTCFREKKTEQSKIIALLGCFSCCYGNLSAHQESLYLFTNDWTVV